MRINLLFSFLLTFVLGCVGTIENSQTPVSETQSPVPGKINFAGIYSIKTVSDTRLEIYFPQATGGSGKYIYDVYIGSDRKESFPDEVLTKDQGLYQLLLSGFSVFSKIAIRVEARDAVENALSDNGIVKKETTYGNETCRFDGIVDLSNVAGESGKDSLKVKWVPAEIISVGHEANPVSYEIVLVKRGKSDGSGVNIGKDQMDSTTEGRYVFTVPWAEGLNEYVVRGLSSDYKYLARVRCIHSTSENNFFYPELRSELNNKTIERATLNDQFATMSGLSTLTQTPTNLSGQGGLTGLNLAWSQITGAFDHFRVYFSTTNSSPTITSECNPVNCKKEKYDVLNSILTGLTPHTTYYLRLVICGNSTCSTSFTSQNSVSKKTTPSIASFSGISGVDLDYNLESIGSATLRFPAPDLSNGFAEKFQLRIKIGDNSWEKVEDQSIIKLDTNYDLGTASTLRISGIELGSSEKYCFRLNLSLGTNSEDSNTQQSCIDVSGTTSDTVFNPPTKDHFQGILGYAYNDYLLFKWKKPTNGFYSHYKLYVSTLETFDPSATTSYELDRYVFESSMVGNIMEGRFPINITGTTKYYFKMKTIFPNPYIAGEFPSEENMCTWQCQKTGNLVTCSNHRSNECPILE